MPEAVWFDGPQRVEIRQEPVGAVGPDDVRVRSLVSGVSAGSELLVYRGSAPRELQPDLPTVRGDFGFPIKFAYASVGRVIEVGSHVDQLAVDDLVFVHHPHQTEYVVPADAPVRLPEGLPADVGVFAANLETAVTVVLDAHPRLGEAVLVAGQGVVGLLITMLLRRAGATPIVTADLHERRRAASVAAGADHALGVDVDLVDAVLDLTDGRGVDIAVEVSGSPAALQACIDATAFAGTVVVASWYGTRDVSLSLGDRFHRRRLRVVSSQVSTLDPALAPRWDRARRTALVSALLTELPLTRADHTPVPVGPGGRRVRAARSPRRRVPAGGVGLCLRSVSRGRSTRCISSRPRIRDASHEHSHDYRAEVVARGERLDEDAMLVDLDLLGAALSECLAELDSVDLGSLAAFEGRNTTVETVAEHIWTQVRDRLAGAAALADLRVTVYESADAWASVDRPVGGRS